MTFNGRRRNSVMSVPNTAPVSVVYYWVKEKSVCGFVLPTWRTSPECIHYSKHCRRPPHGHTHALTPRPIENNLNYSRFNFYIDVNEIIVKFNVL